MTDRAPMTLRRLVLELPAMADVTARSVVYQGDLALDLYATAAAPGARRPAVVFVTGYPDPMFAARFGCGLKDMASTVAWAQLAAVSGLVGVTYANREPGDVDAVLDHLWANADAYGIDLDRVAVWASSGNAPMAMRLLQGGARHRLRCAALCYGYLLDLDGTTAVADAQRVFQFANPCAGTTVADLRADLPLLLVRAGGDATPGLNGTIDRFAAAALARDLPVTIINHAGAPHAFDIVDDRDASRGVIHAIASYLRAQLGAA